MTPRTRALCYVVGWLLLTAAGHAPTVPQRVPAADEAQQVDDAAEADAARAAHEAAPGPPVPFGPQDAVVLGERTDGTPVAEPSTLLLVSCGLFGLIAWSRCRR